MNGSLLLCKNWPALQELATVQNPCLHILCRGHLMVTIMDHATTEVGWQTTAAAQFVKLYCQALGGREHGPKLRRLRDKIHDALTAEQEGTETSRRRALDLLSSNFANKDDDDILSRLSKVVSNLAKTYYEAQVEAIVADDNLSSLEKVAQCRALLEKQPDTSKAQFALLNDTRWHSSLYLCYRYVLQNLTHIVTWVCQEKNTPSVQELLALVQSKEQAEEVRRQLSIYIETFELMATYVNDLANGNVKTFEIIDREQVIKRCLQKCIDRRDTPQFQRDLASKLLNEMNTYHPEGDAESLFRFCRMLSPVRLADLRTDDHLSHHAAEKACYFKIPLVEWNMYMRVILEDADYIVAEDEDDPARWWLERKDTFPILSGIEVSADTADSCHVLRQPFVPRRYRF